MTGSLLMVLGLVLVAGCGWGSGTTQHEVIPTTHRGRPLLLCDLIAIPLREMKKDGITFSDLVNDRSASVDVQGLDAMVALGLLARGSDQAGKFEPVLRYLALRAAKDAGETPVLTKRVRQNAQALDLELAREGCP
jgi:hypothetical protein